MNKHISTIFYLALLLVSAVLTGCIKEKGSDYCPTAAHYLIVRSFDADNKEITGTGAVREVVLYVFDNNGAYTGKIIGAENAHIPLDYPEGSQLTLVGWANSQNGKQIMPQLAQGTPIDQALVTLTENSSQPAAVPAGSKASPQIGSSSASPDDLFWGTGVVSLNSLEGQTEVGHELNIKRKVASISVVIKGLQEWAGTSDTDFSIVINGTRKSIDFRGNKVGNPTLYLHQLLKNENGLFVTGIFNTFPSADTRITIDVYKGSEKIYTVTTDGENKPFVLDEGRLLNVFIDFTRNAAVTFTVTEWGKVDINQDF